MTHSGQSNRQRVIEERIIISELLPGSRLRFVHGLHPGKEVEVEQVGTVSVYYHFHHGSSNKRMKASHDWVISHMEWA